MRPFSILKQSFRVFSPKTFALLMGAAACLSFNSTSSAQSPKPDVSKPIDLIEVDARINHLMNGDDMVGLSIAIIENGQIKFAKGYGETRLGSGDRVTKDTVFRWASVSKGVASALAVLFAEDGYFNLDAPVDPFSPSIKLPEEREPLSLDDILSQRSGLARNAFDRDIEAGTYPKTLRARLGGVKTLCEPGSCHSYQNVLYDAVAEMIETASGLPYKASVSEHLFRPLGMTTASVTREGLTRSKSWARPHNKYGEVKSGVKPTYYRIPAAAGVNSSVEDLGRWLLAQMDMQPDVLSRDNLDLLQRPRVFTPREEQKMKRSFNALQQSRYGLGWRMYRYIGREVVGHRGAVEGYRSTVLFDRELKTGVAILWNSSSPRPIGLQLEIFDQIYGHPKRDWMRLG